MTTAPYFDLIVMTVSGAPGTGDVTLGAPVAGYLGLSNYNTSIPDGTPIHYSLIDPGANSESGSCIYRTPAASSTTYGKLTSRTPKASTNSGSAISASTSTVARCTLLAEDVATTAVLSNFVFTASSDGQSAFAGLDDNSNILSYFAATTIIVALNGSVLAPADFTATDGVTVTLAQGVNAGDSVTIYSFQTTGTVAIASVFGRSGNVIAQESDYDGYYLSYANASMDLIGQGATTTVTVFLQPASPAAGRAYAFAAQIEGDGEAGQKVGVYGAAECSGTGADDIWGGNFLAQWASSNDVNVQAVEIDLNNNQSDTFSALKTGLSVNSGGSHHGGYGLLINSTTVDNAWKTAILIPAGGSLAGIAIGDPTGITGDLSVKQLSNGDDTILLQRNTDSGMSGQLLRAVNEANSENILIIDVQGNVTTKGIPLFLNDFSMPAGGVTGTGLLMSATANFGTFFGSGAPTLSAAQGSLYLRSDGNSTSTRAYINTNGGTGWTALMTAA